MIPPTRTHLVAALLAFLAGCSRPAEDATSTTLPPADAPHRYLGRWAPDVQQCHDASWKFEERRLTSPSNVTCDFTRVSAVPGGYDISATCSIDAKTDDIKVRFAESARAMLVESKTFPSMGLIFCGSRA